ncbi:L-piperidine-6-carboxylate dehydrogenase [Humisphaera borealis]|uniref:Aldehyde dehydrogenase family protein n=1 Tax=Humisphaera borealis TaxID=2807512 RepID=A0A7M2X204_9BACT|nr:aldehyde dehydrogenase family protein [Humisphaera borealis]QOV91629.1 aldehyde dehydrogenase family protein [Humisphaera borealis]
MQASDALRTFGIDASVEGVAVGRGFGPGTGPALAVRSPIDGQTLATVQSAAPTDVRRVVAAASRAFQDWRLVPAPRRGEFVRRIGQKLRERKADLAAIVSWEAGKITQEALGEVQEMIDIADFAVGLSRQLHGLTIASERPGHRMMEQWHPLGPVGVITAFNFPVAVWAWNAMLALACGDSVIWKPSEKTPLTAVACQRIVADVMADMPEVPDAISCLLVGDATNVGRPLAASVDVSLISATGSTRMGKEVATTVAGRLGRSLLELGGNNGLILTPSADLNLAIRAIVFAAVGTAGQRCTTLRRLIVHRSIKEEVIGRLLAVYSRLKIGNPLDEGVLVGPLIDEAAYDAMQQALADCRDARGRVYGGERITAGVPAGGVYVRPAIVEINPHAPVITRETFAPILHVMPYETMDEAIEWHNAVPQGLSSAIFTSDIREAERFMGPAGSDCGIANVNIGTSGAEIGGAFGGEKETGGGRESGSDAWKAYMRRTTNTINYSTGLPLAQGISFEV